MSRLTYKDTKVSGGYNAVDTDEYACVVKLGKLEDIEEELGCPLEVVFKALEKGFYVDTKKVEKEPSWEKPERISLIGCPKYFRLNLWYKTIEVDRFGHYLEIWLKDYKKTWWLKEDRSE